MMTYAVYDAGGSVLQIGRCHEAVAPAISADAQGRFGRVDEALFDPTTPPDYYVTNPGSETLILRAKEKLAPRYTIEGLSIVFCGLPAGTVVDTGAGSMVAGGGEDVVECEAPGAYFIELIGPSAKHAITDVEVTVG